MWAMLILLFSVTFQDLFKKVLHVKIYTLCKKLVIPVTVHVFASEEYCDLLVTFKNLPRVTIKFI